MTSKEFVKIAKECAIKYKTLYVLGCFGAPLNETNKKRYTSNLSYNKKRANIINKAQYDTFGFDCVCLIKSILWGWNGNVNKTYGGATYCSNNVPDVGADQIMNYCRSVSSNFSNIQEGEIVHIKGHVGIYVGDGLVVECTPKWQNKVQLTVLKNIVATSGNGRTWNTHGKLKFIDYNSEEKPSETYLGHFPTLPKRGYFWFNPKTPKKVYDTGLQVKYVQLFLNWAIGAGLEVDGLYRTKNIYGGM